MIIKRISCKNFRNYKDLDLSFEDNSKFNIISATNGMGKSNLLEMFYYLSHVRPFRNVNDKDLIKKEENYFIISCDYKKNNLDNNIDIKYNNKVKNILYNDKKIIKHSELLGKLLTVLFSTEDIYIINGSPELRRRYFNIFFSILDKTYLENLKKYENLLKQKNCILKSGKKEILPYFDYQISDSILYIQKKREEMIEKISLIFSKSFIEIGIFKENVSLKYMPSIKNEFLEKELLINLLKKQNEIDINRGFSTIGIHKDDYIFKINNISFSKYASFGQVRLASLILKYVQSNLYSLYFNSNPILLIDDVILELDKERQKRFINYLGENNQIFITVTDKSYKDIFNNKNLINIIEVNNGTILQ